MSLLEKIASSLETEYILDESKQDIETFARAINKEIGDLDRSYKIANDFFQQKDRFKSSNPNSDIRENDYRTWIENKDGKHSISTLISRLDSGSNTRIKKQQKMGGAIKIPTKNPDWEVIHITDYNAAKYYGENTTWCITGRYPNQGGDERGRGFFNNYIKNGVKGYYFLIDKKDSYNKWCYLDYGKNDVSDIHELFFDARDRSYTLSAVLDDIPMDVLEVLPHIKDTIEQQKQLLSIIDEVKKTGIYTCTKNHTTSIKNGIEKYVKKVLVDDSVTFIGDFAFYNCTSLKGVTIPNSVTSIGTSAFKYCTSLKGITIPNSVTSIGTSAFYNCTSLQEITIPNSVTSIGYAAFYNCTSLKGVTIPNSVTSIGDFAFYRCTSLQNITLPNSVTFIGTSAFSDCTSLQEITLPNSVTSIGDAAFSDCTSLKEITIRGKYRPSMVKDIPSRINIIWADAVQNESYHIRRYYWWDKNKKKIT